MDRLIGFGSFVINTAQCNYCTTMKDLLTVVRFIRHFKYYLLGRRFTLRTDHNSILLLIELNILKGNSLGGLRNLKYIIRRLCTDLARLM